MPNIPKFFPSQNHGQYARIQTFRVAARAAMTLSPTNVMSRCKVSISRRNLSFGRGPGPRAGCHNDGENIVPAGSTIIGNVIPE